jgi:hypothetical protein
LNIRIIKRKCQLLIESTDRIADSLIVKINIGIGDDLDDLLMGIYIIGLTCLITGISFLRQEYKKIKEGSQGDDIKFINKSPKSLYDKFKYKHMSTWKKTTINISLIIIGLILMTTSFIFTISYFGREKIIPIIAVLGIGTFSPAIIIIYAIFIYESKTNSK